VRPALEIPAAAVSSRTDGDVGAEAGDEAELIKAFRGPPPGFAEASISCLPRLS